MPDLAHSYGGDLTLSATGDLALSTGADETRDRVLRRLLTSPGAYLWHLDYGAGLAGMIGRPINPGVIQAVAQQQMLLEAAVATSPPPTVAVSPGQAGAVFASISYIDAPSGTPQVLSLPKG